jgi:hypothetical protein
MSDSSDDMEAWSGLCDGDDTEEKDREKIEEILKYCMPHLKYMWAAKIVGIILDCDFRDSRQELKKYWEERYEK